MKLTNAITFENHHVEMSFLRNSLSINCNKITRDTFIKEDVEIAVGSNLFMYLKFLYKNREQIKIFIHLSDEKYRLSNIFLYSIFPRNIVIFRQYLDDTVNIPFICRFIRQNIANISLVDISSAGYSFFFGLSKIFKLFLLRFLRNKVNYFPLGYTDNFVEHVEKERVTLDLNKFSTTLWSDFRGLKGNFDRNFAIKTIQNRSISVYVNSEWGGSANNLTSNYVKSLQRGILSFCPPGFLNTDTFRYYESLYLGNLPVKLLLSFNSLSFNSYTYLYPMLYSWDALFDFYENLSPAEIVELIKIHLFYYEMSLEATKLALVKNLAS